VTIRDRKPTAPVPLPTGFRGGSGAGTTDAHAAGVHALPQDLTGALDPANDVHRRLPGAGRAGASLTPAERDALDRDAMARILASDETGLEELYDRHAELAFTVAMRTVRDHAEAEDVVHDVFLAVVERAHQFEPSRGSLLSWLVIMVRNLALDRARLRGRRAQIIEEQLCHEPSEPALDPESHSSLERRGAEVRGWLASISAAQRRTLEIAFFEGLSYTEIAEREGVPLGTVKSRAARGIIALRAAIGPQGVAR